MRMPRLYDDSMCLFLILPIVDVIAFGGLHLFLEVGNAGFNQYIVPTDELLDVADVDTVAVPLSCLRPRS